MSNANRRLARKNQRVGLDLWNSQELKTHINTLLAPFRSTFEKIEYGIIVGAIQKMVHDDANGIDVKRLNPGVPTSPVRDIDEAKSRAGWYVDNWVMTRIAELKKIKIDVDGEGKARIGVELEPAEDASVIIGGDKVRMGQISMTAEKPANPWDDK